VERLVLATFASSASLTRPELEELTGLSRTVVDRVVASLVAQGELAELRQPPTGGARGRPAARYQRTALLSPVLLIQLRKNGPTWVSSLRGDGARSETRQCAPWSQEWPVWSGSVLQAVERLRDWTQLPPRLVVLSVPFPVAEAGRHEAAFGGLRVSPWLEDDPSLALSDLLGCKALVVNDANLAALGEASFGAGRGRRGVCYVSVANGVGVGLVFDGRLFSGAHGFSGELGHVQVDPEGAPCPCGNRGCLATMSAAQGMLRRPAAWDGAELGSLVGRALAPLVTVLDPDCVVADAAHLGQQCDSFIAAVAAELARRCPPVLTRALVVVPGELSDAERYGALAVADAHATALVSEATWPRPLAAAGDRV
jgi:predicted NBD/HSP70 family sugar kinase